MTKSRRELLDLAKVIDADHEYIMDCVHIARYGTELAVMGKLYEIDETIGGMQCEIKKRYTEQE